MVRNFSLATASIALAVAPTAASAASMGFNLRATVPMYCTVKHEAIGYGAPVNGGISLGQFREYCNAPSGYQLVVLYTPGTMRGARISADGDEVVLNGSGQAVLSRATGPRIRQRVLSATPGEQGFDTDRLELQIIPA